MTIEEKRQAIRNYCDNNDHSGCFAPGWECPLWKVNDDCYQNHVSDNQVEINYQRLVDAGAIEGEATPDTTANPVPDNVNHPSHYTQGGMECIDEMFLIFGKEAVKHFCICNAWKYRKRAMFKNGQEDIDKSDWYINKYKELSADGTTN